jgi:oleate hydratase
VERSSCAEVPRGLHPANRCLFDEKYSCTFDLLETIRSVANPYISVKDEFFAFNKRHPIRDQAHIIDCNGHIVHSPHFGLSARDCFGLVRLSLTAEAKLDGRRIDEFSSPKCFTTEFWLL